MRHPVLLTADPLCVIGFMTEGLNVKWGAVSPMKSTAKALIHVGFENKIVAFKF